MLQDLRVETTVSFPGVDLLTLVYAWKRDGRVLGNPVLIFFNLIFKRPSIVFPIIAVPIFIPPAAPKSPPLLRYTNTCNLLWLYTVHSTGVKQQLILLGPTVSW